MKRPILFFGILILAMAQAALVQAQVPVTNGLVAYYPLNGNATDGSGNGYNGVLNGNTITSATNEIGYPAGALHFGGSSYMSVTPTPFLVNSNWTISLWFTIDAGNTSPNNLLSTGNDGGGGVNMRYVASDSQQWQLILDGNEGPLYFNATNNANQWNMWTCTKNGPIYEQYLNGTLVDSNALSGSSTDAGSLWFGEQNGGNSWALNGSLSDIFIFNRALLVSEIGKLYIAGAPPCVPHNATAIANVVDGFVVSATITDNGCGMINTPLVLIEGGGGTGATATAQIFDGVVTGITITDAGIGYTNTPTIVIYSLPSITNQPQSVVATAYEPAMFTVGAGGYYPLSYQWLFNGAPIANNGTTIFGATSNILTISNVTQGNLGTYAVTVTNAFGSITSSNATLTMYPFIAVPFTGAVAYRGQSVTFNVTALGTGPLSYQWFDNALPILNATNQTYTLTNLQFTNNGLYSVVVSNSLGSATNTPEQLVVNPLGVSLGFCPALTIQGAIGDVYVIQSSTNLANKNAWITVTNLTLTQPVQVWVDTRVNVSLPTNSMYFYQVLPGQ